jgi:hypothetical protein
LRIVYEGARSFHREQQILCEYSWQKLYPPRFLAAPRGPLTVGLRLDGLAPGETAFATIAAVDAGILSLTGFAPPARQGGTQG